MRPMTTKRFTLIELLTVMAIIFVLAGLLMGVSSVVSRNMREARTKARMSAMVTALQEYYQDRGYYPQLTNANAGWVSLNIVVGDFKNTQTTRPYIEGFGTSAFASVTNAFANANDYLDGWERPFQYTIDPSEVGAEGYRIRSGGQDKVQGTDDDICSWKQH